MDTQITKLGLVIVVLLWFSSPDAKSQNFEQGAAFSNFNFSDLVNYDPPKKLGISGSWVWQQQPYSIDSFELNGISFDPTFFDVPPGVAILPPPPPMIDTSSITKVENEADTFTARLDYWLLPFLNIYGILGDVQGQVNVSVDVLPETLNFSYDGFVYGVGAVIAGGYKDLFFSTDTSYTITDLDDGYSIETWVVSPKLGIKKGPLAAWVGMTYQLTEHKQSGTIDVVYPFIIDYTALLTDDYNWNYTVGIKYEINEDWEFLVEGGLGERNQALVSIGRRF